MLPALIIFPLLLALLFVWVSVAYGNEAAESGLLKKETSQKKLLYQGLLLSAIYGSGMAAVSLIWYSREAQTRWHWFNDLPEWMQLDKFGHFYTTFQIARLALYFLKTSALTEKQRSAASALTAFLLVSAVEFLDGFAVSYGASATDLAANAAGALFLLIQQLGFGKVLLVPKFSFHQSPFAAQRPAVLGHNLGEELLKDYNGQTYWLNIPFNSLLPQPLRLFPAWLNLALGYGIDSVLYGRTQQNQAQGLQPFRQFYLSLNINLRALPFFRNRPQNKLLRITSFWFEGIQLPFPALELNPQGLKWHWLYY